ncbi:MAG: zinc-binding alcohol dehydrogenase family protein [Candidatus Eremiobacteraeota bacterium]|nr:zinc-binding alcohol dehydrogenase family protein [Candidatus Eremiobacteraeota bacterium]MBV8338645.1 zinc-binding alcohol dehydrogenase family protein [Candidatus Eremiobacteraeota bacterium]MBV8461115.1 zinc-binding alcohol dehydrogenase family protein [Candidatus Eremiobacteraeota bacterium]
MKAAVVTEPGRAPVYADFQTPQPQQGSLLIRVTAAAITQLAKLRADGKHYSDRPTYPFIAGVDGTGITEDGRRVYFMLPDPPFGSMAECCVISEKKCIPLPDGLSDVKAAAMANPGMSSWPSLIARAHLRKGETVLVNGASGTSGRLAIVIAKHLGAQRVIATARRTNVFDELKRLGADETVALTSDTAALKEAFETVMQRGVDVVLDYLWGPSAEAIIAAAHRGPQGVPIRFVQVGSMSGESIELPAAALRSSSLQLIGSGIGSLSFADVGAAISDLFKATCSAEFPISVASIPLSDVTKAWSMTETDARIVLIP